MCVSTPHDLTQLDATDSEMVRILRLAEKPTKSVVVQLSRVIKRSHGGDHSYDATQQNRLVRVWCEIAALSD